eukprot:5421127-Amphidinium_carterae.1
MQLPRDAPRVSFSRVQTHNPSYNFSLKPSRKDKAIELYNLLTERSSPLQPAHAFGAHFPWLKYARSADRLQAMYAAQGRGGAQLFHT